MTEQSKINGMNLTIQPNEEIESVYTDQERQLIYEDGQKARSLHHKRKTNPYSIPEAKDLWLKGWHDHGRLRTNKRQRERYWRNKYETVSGLQKVEEGSKDSSASTSDSALPDGKD